VESAVSWVHGSIATTVMGKSVRILLLIIKYKLLCIINVRNVSLLTHYLDDLNAEIWGLSLYKTFFCVNLFLSLVGKMKDTPLKEIFNVINLVNWFHCVLGFLNNILVTILSNTFQNDQLKSTLIMSFYSSL